MLSAILWSRPATISAPLLWFLVLATCASLASAGPVSLSDAQKVKLRELVKSDPDAKRRFEELKRQADGALKDDGPYA
jgi:hypothetical protein